MEWYELNESDIWALMRFDLLVHPKEDQPSRDDYLEAFALGIAFYALKENRAAQEYIATFQLMKNPEREDSTIFTGVGVHPSHARQGHGHDIIKKIEDMHPSNHLQCKTRAGNENMIALLKSHGFENTMDDLKGGYWKRWTKEELN